MPEQNIDIVKHFLELLDDQKNYDEAAKLLEDDFSMTSPKENFKTKSDWRKRFPETHKSAPVFQEPNAVEDANGNQVVTRKGCKKIGFVNVNLVETYQVNQNGKIQSITVARG